MNLFEKKLNEILEIKDPRLAAISIATSTELDLVEMKKIVTEYQEKYNVSKMSPATKRKNSHSEFISWKNPHSGFSAAAGSISSVGVGYNPPPIDRQPCCEKKFAKRICFME